MRIESIPFHIIKSIKLLECFFNQIHYRSISESHREAVFLNTAKIINLQKISSSIKIDRGTHILGELLTFAHAGSIQIGEFCYVGENSRIWSAQNITIGDRVLISHNVNIHDTNGHPINALKRHEHSMQIFTSGHPSTELDILSEPILIEDDVWIGFSSTILKGVKIGKGSIIGASSVVTKDVPPDTVVAGNPARIIRNLNQDKSNENTGKT
jgi:acetyltransferase-like isoleucine patch superfamily enzyme